MIKNILMCVTILAAACCVFGCFICFDYMLVIKLCIVKCPNSGLKDLM